MTMTRTAPSDAPLLTPTMPGSASGLPNSPCIAAPAIASEPPTSSAMSARGRRRSQNTAWATGWPSAASSGESITASSRPASTATTPVETAAASPAAMARVSPA